MSATDPVDAEPLAQKQAVWGGGHFHSFLKLLLLIYNSDCCPPIEDLKFLQLDPFGRFGGVFLSFLCNHLNME